MILKSYHCRLPLDPPFYSRGAPVHCRDTVIIRGENGEWAEAAPLPGFSQDRITDVVADANNRRLTATKCRSLQFARDCLLHDEWATVDLPINALLDGPMESVTQNARAIAKSSCRCVKLKVGRTDIQEDIERVAAVRAILRDHQSIRLDANRAWEWDAAVEFGSAVAELDVEYIEEPLAVSPDHAIQLERFVQVTGCPYALDESLVEHSNSTDAVASRDEALYAYESASAFVVKPTLLGAIDEVRRLAAMGKPLVFSGCFESGIGTAQIARIAAQFSPDIPAGLDTHSRIADDLIEERLIDASWSLRLAGRPKICEAKLQELTQ